MPHDKFGDLIEIGDMICVMYRVTAVQPGNEYCNVTAETIEPMYPGAHKTISTFNSKQVEKLTVSSAIK